MAGGLGARLFVAGDVITAADVNGYLMNQSMMRFATTGARDTAFGNGIPVGQTVGGIAGDGKPLLQEGMFAYIDFNNDVQFFNGSTWVSAPTFVLADGEVTTAKLADDAVTGSKIADNAITAAHIADGTIIAADIADGSVTSAKILDGTIVNADINASAAIALSKLATGALPTAITIASANITDLSIVNADVNASAAIDKTKISGTAVTLADTGTVTSTMIANDTILDADIKSNAAISYSKLSLSNSIATTDLAAGAARAGFNSTQNQVVTASSNYTLVLGDLAKLVEVNEASSCTLTIPTNASVAFAVGDRIDVLQTGAGQVTITPVSGTVTINGYDGGLKLNGQWAAATLIKRATNTWVAVGNLTT